MICDGLVVVTHGWMSVHSDDTPGRYKATWRPVFTPIQRAAADEGCGCSFMLDCPLMPSLFPCLISTTSSTTARWLTSSRRAEGTGLRGPGWGRWVTEPDTSLYFHNQTSLTKATFLCPPVCNTRGGLCFSCSYFVRWKASLLRAVGAGLLTHFELKLLYLHLVHQLPSRNAALKATNTNCNQCAVRGRVSAEQNDGSFGVITWNSVWTACSHRGARW